ncbi:hypothetical protein VTN00DRAFT_5568 [Thermoascus crustaceus]|uniref:uncharacterized protein n=1 Tax=Thermoascus crustaceus TaxID=5088 RepID=UPI003744A0EC
MPKTKVEEKKAVTSSHIEEGRAPSATATSAHELPYTKSLAFYSRSYSGVNIAKLILAPLATLLNPAVLWVQLEKYKQSDDGQCPVIGGIIGCLSGSWLCVATLRALTKANGDYGIGC